MKNATTLRKMPEKFAVVTVKSLSSTKWADIFSPYAEGCKGKANLPFFIVLFWPTRQTPIAIAENNMGT